MDISGGFIGGRYADFRVAGRVFASGERRVRGGVFREELRGSLVQY